MHLLNKHVIRLKMTNKVYSQFIVILFLAFSANFSHADSALETNDSSLPTYTLPTLTVQGQEIANLRPSSTYQSIVSNLDFDPRIDFQSRNMAEAQGDINIRGGIFEGTGIQIGAATLIDPQTGHYSTELPIAPEMLTRPKVLTGASNALRGFNSTAGTLSYQWSEIIEGSSLTIGGGQNALNFQRIHSATTHNFADSNEWTYGTEFEYSRSESDGTVANSDHDFNRVTGRFQLIGPNSQSDFFAGYHSKFFGQEGMYVGFGSPETEYLKTRLFILNHQMSYANDSHLQATAYYRENSDHYNYNRFSPDNKYIHFTKVSSFALAGLNAINPKFDLNYSLQLTQDSINSTTLEEGKFNNRSYYKLSLVPQYRYTLNNQQEFLFKAGISYDGNNRNNSELSGIAEVRLVTDRANGDSEQIYLSYAKTTQVAGYSAVGGSEESGYWLSNHNLLREITHNVEFGYSINRSQWSLDTALFYRWDKDLADWIFFGVEKTRKAENVDIETFGFEIIGAKNWEHLEVIASYSHLQRNEDYKNPNVIGSFYALNYPRHRATLGLIYTPNAYLEFRLDNEWREQEKKKSIRRGEHSATFTNLGISYFPNQTQELELFLVYQKPWKDGFEEIPRTVGGSDQFSLGLTHEW